MKPNIVLVHGAWADGSMWTHVIRELQAQGFYVTAVQNPLTSLDDDVATTRSVLARQQGPTVLVGHSYGGAVITAAATEEDNVAALVYIAALGLAQDESPATLLESYGTLANLVPDENGFILIDRADFAGGFLPDYDPSAVAVMAATQKPTSVHCLTDKIGPPAWKSKPSWFQIAENDAMIPPAALSMMAARMNATTTSIAAPHGSLVSHPREVAQVIMDAANAVSS
ncbi:alpha/beta fold hydrolase [Rhodococcus tibetensis]|uniref:Alpha/beta hydrolase n=1 Tax=Rhodococcus tibetensis TaxID=2965064 RepID=A0ABT1QMJ4_9NOCA|nr:alpha/beta hydrolase [Rhodococcus sp. FXJ9.536]MCQ4122322.1 alpha/beta hydrolase [Rhodococcus sp. FXJ9.536]